MLKKYALLVIVGLNSLLVFSQNTTNNLRTKKCFYSVDTLFLDTLSVIPSAFKITDSNGKTVPNSFYKLQFSESYLVWKSKPETFVEPFTASFRVFPVNFSKPYFNKDSKAIVEEKTGSVNPFILNYDNKEEDIFKTDGLNKNGSISRGIAFGNNQDIVVNSNLNLEMSGKVTETISIKAVIADDNIPIQPEGNTQQLQEFDQVFIQLYDAKSKLIAGDFQLSKPKSYFANYYKRAQGGSFSTSLPLYKNKNQDEEKPNSKLEFNGSAAVSKGKFARNVILGIEGNQGPYRLRGAENELFIVVLAGTEKVYIDGQLLNRGQENDYIIDYNTAEITFTAKRLINKDKRIVAEFQYADRNYARSLAQFGTNFESEKLAVHFNIYTEQDNKSRPFLQELNSSDKFLLQQIGDDLNQALVSSADTTSFSDNLVLYEKKDTIINGIIYNPIYVYSTNPDSAIYKLTFSDVGVARGNYVQAQSAANGKVFKWVAPINGTPQGQYEPVVLLVTPKQKQLITLATDYKINKNTNSSLELALSNNDLNTFSSFDSKDDIGYGIKYALENSKKITNDSVATFLNSFVKYEFVTRTFSPIERFRAVEFERDWNRLTPQFYSDQHIVSAGSGIEKNKVGKSTYQVSSFLEGSNYNGIMQSVYNKWHVKGFDMLAQGSLLQSKGEIYNSQFLRHKAEISKNIFNKLVIGVREEQEQSKLNESVSDSLRNESFDYFEWQAFVKQGDTTTMRYGLSYIERTDWKANNNKLNKFSLGKSYLFDFQLPGSKYQQLKTTITYRTLEITDSTITTLKPDNTLLGRLEHELRLFKGAIIASTFYEIGSGLEAKKEFTYLEVAAGQGFYTWIDYNENGVKELNEFEIAAFKDQAKYIRVLIPTAQYVKAYTNQFNEAVTINPGALWSNKKGIKKFMSRFYNQTAYRIDRKTNNTLLSENYNPFNNDSLTTNLVSLNSSLRNTFFFNRSNTKFGADYTYQNLSNRIQLTNGFETRQNEFNTIRPRWNITRKWLLQGEYTKGVKSSKSEFFSNRDFQIAYQEVEPKITYQAGVSFRVALSHKYSNKFNTIGEANENAFTNKTNVEIRFNEVKKGSLTANIAAININYTGALNSPIAFEMLEGLTAGQNYVWSVSYQRNLSANMQLTLNYDGRKPTDIKAIHTGGVQVRAFF
ncbi:MAG: hypothetical protein V4667_00135 [Bacteroidota bacterium]